MSRKQYIHPIVDTTNVEPEQMLAGSIPLSSDKEHIFQGDNRTNRTSEFSEGLW